MFKHSPSLTSFLMGAMLSLSLTPYAYAETAVAEAASKAAICEDQQAGRPLFARLFQDISLALWAAHHADLEESAKYIASAEQIIDDLTAKNAVMSTHEAIRAARLDYKIGKQAYFLLLPLNEASALPSLTLGAGKKPKERYVPLDSKVVYLGITIDATKVKSSLADTWHAIALGDIGRLAYTLQDTLASINHVQVPGKPNALRELDDYMILTDNLLKKQEYAYAKKAITHMKDALKAYGDTLPKAAGDTELQDLNLRITTLHQELQENNPGKLQKTLQAFSAWKKAIKAWMTKETHSKLL